MKQHSCNPEQAVLFVERIRDIFVGYRNCTVSTNQNPKIDFERMAQSIKCSMPIAQYSVGCPWRKLVYQDDYVKRLRRRSSSVVSTEFLKHALIDATYDYISTKRDEYNPGKPTCCQRCIRAAVGRWIDMSGRPEKQEVKMTISNFLDQMALSSIPKGWSPCSLQ